MKIKDLPKENRPRERFLKHGPQVLSDAELFAILLRTGSKGENVIDMSNRLIAEIGLNKLFDCSLKELQQIKGIGPSKAMQILVMHEILTRIHLAEKPIKKISCAKDVFDLYHERLKDEKQEHFIVLMLDTKNNILGEETVFKGTLDASIVHPREIFKTAIKNSASKIILIHNHPSGNPEPSSDDNFVSNKLQGVGNLINLNIVDQIIIGKDKYWSQKEQTA